MKFVASLLTFSVLSAGMAKPFSLRGGQVEQLQQQEQRELNYFKPAPVDNTRGIWYPAFRYVPWDLLDEQTKERAAILSYSNDTWNMPGTGDIESDDFDTIIQESKEENTTVAQTFLIMGWSREMYNCYINHYEAFSWGELETQTDAAPYWVALGWNSSSWVGDTEHPPTDGMDWDELSEEERQAAIALCYFEELWSGTNLNEWSEYQGDASTFVPSMEATADASMQDTVAVTDVQNDVTQSPDMSVHEQAQFISVRPVPASPVDVREPPTTGLPTKGPTPLPTTSAPKPTASGFYVPNPNNRYLLWEWLFDVSKAAATTLGYNEASWNQPMSAAVESMTFDNLSMEQKEAAYVLGLAPAEVWDCHINHFMGFTWENLGKAQQYWKQLGWSEESWNALANPPLSDNLSFDELSEEEQDAAEQLCFRAETWDVLNLNEWVV